MRGVALRIITCRGAYLNGAFNIYGGAIKDNNSDGDGGGVYAGGNTSFNVLVEDGNMGQLTGNTASWNGAAIYVGTWANATLKNVLIENNNCTHTDTVYAGSAIEFYGYGLTLGGNVQIKNNFKTVTSAPKNLMYRGILHAFYNNTKACIRRCFKQRILL